MYNDTHEAAAPPNSQLSDEALYSRTLQCFPTATALASALDHTQLKPDATRSQVIALAAEAAEHRFACAMVNPAWVPLVRDALAGTGIRVGTVLGFPLGASLSVSKSAEAHAAARAGALDLDVVLNIGALRSGMFEDVAQELHLVADVAHSEGAIIKVILETCLLDHAEKRIAAELCLAAGADFVKTSTGFSTGGATVADIVLLREVVGERAGVKASGGIRTLSDAVSMTMAGANRIGASASVAILQAYRALAAE